MIIFSVILLLIIISLNNIPLYSASMLSFYGDPSESSDSISQLQYPNMPISRSMDTSAKYQPKSPKIQPIYRLSISPSSLAIEDSGDEFYPTLKMALDKVFSEDRRFWCDKANEKQHATRRFSCASEDNRMQEIYYFEFSETFSSTISVHSLRCVLIGVYTCLNNFLIGYRDTMGDFKAKLLSVRTASNASDVDLVSKIPMKIDEGQKLTSQEKQALQAVNADPLIKQWIKNAVFACFLQCSGIGVRRKSLKNYAYAAGRKAAFGDLGNPFIVGGYWINPLLLSRRQSLALLRSFHDEIVKMAAEKETDAEIAKILADKPSICCNCWS